MCTSLFNALSSVPNVVWSGIVASVITLSGVMISNSSNTKRLLSQLRHDADQKEKDRLNNLRRDVYLKAAEEAVRVGRYFSEIPHIDYSASDPQEGIHGFLSAIAKLQLVCEPETSKLTIELNTRYAETFMLLLEKASPIHKLNTDIKIENSFYEREQSNIERLIAEMQQINESGNPDSLRFTALNRSFEHSQKSATRHAEARNKALELRQNSLNEYSILLLEKTQPLIQIQNELIASIRKEFGLNGDAEESIKLSKDSFNRMSTSMKKLISFLESENQDLKNMLILTDIEGTTSSISFVKDVLFPYARDALPGFVRTHGAREDVRKWLDVVATEHGAICSDDMIVEILQGWIDEDRKHTALKALQGMIWSDGYRSADFSAHIYPDAAAKLRDWHSAGLPLAVYSSGSVPAQKLFFGHTDAGDLTGLFGGWFDTEVGHKRDAGSYREIAHRLDRPAQEILFLSDVVEELDAAREAGMQTVLIDRLEDYPQPRLGEATHGHDRVERFDQIIPS